jgi:hypothetical protein
MLDKNKFLVLKVMSLLILTESIASQELKCANGTCQIDVKNFNPSHCTSKPSSFKKQNNFRFMPKEEDIDIRVTHEERGLNMLKLEEQKYIQQQGEYLEPLTEEEENTIVLDPNKYIMSQSEVEKYNEEQNQIARTQLYEERELDERLIEEDEGQLPMSLFYCENNTKPIYNKELREFQCVI